MKASCLLAGEICPGDKYFTKNFFHGKSFSSLGFSLLLLLYSDSVCLFIDVDRIWSFYRWVSLS